MLEIIALIGKQGLPLIPDSDKKLRSFQPTAATHFHRYIKGANGSAPVIQTDSTIILDARVFEGGSDTPTMRDYIKTIREAYSGGPRILCLRFDTQNDSIARNDIEAGATATLFYMGNISDATRRMNAFIDTGELPSPRRGRVVTMANTAPLYGISEDSNGDELPVTPDTSVPKKPVSRPLPESKSMRTKDPGAPPQGASVSAPKKPAAIQPPAATFPITENELGGEEMSALLTALTTLIGQHAQMITILEKMQVGIDDLRANRKAALLGQPKEEVDAAINTVFAQLKQGGEAPSALTRASADTTLSSAPSTAPSSGAEEIPPSVPEKAPPIATITKGDPFMANVSLFGKTIPLLLLSAELFACFVNSGQTLGPRDIPSKRHLTSNGGYARITKLRKELNAFRKGLSSCLMLVQAGNSKKYRFDIDAFRKAFGIK